MGYNYSLWVQVPVCKLCTWLRALCLCLQLQRVPFLLKKCGLCRINTWVHEVHNIFEACRCTAFCPLYCLKEPTDSCLEKPLRLNPEQCVICVLDLWLMTLCSTILLCRTPRKSSNVWRVPLCDYIYSVLGNSFSSVRICRLFIRNNLLNFKQDASYMQSYQHLECQISIFLNRFL
jgi:hypothetical protein